MKQHLKMFQNILLQIVYIAEFRRGRVAEKFVNAGRTFLPER